ncbi:39S ribosomal protein L43, mitochondrial-like [Paramacrobiotus metropolitanus]|uniref:39S ribosomal protein L43, mitochondrial-like n=1 Tax=Paramacrobiotus metropolitanus TaxID=2943436 RepID=UPI0024461D41|nr:39S ribosomal protein L43, mitochondrial-like [Paramacrobiotus metropolitanus]
MISDPKGYLKAILQNGLGRYVCQLQRLTFRFCKEQGASRGMRDFIEYDLLDFARRNPGIVVYLQPKRHQFPRLHAEYLNGRKEDLTAPNYSREEIMKWVDYMRCRSGFEIVRFIKDQTTHHPSIQGPWHPFTNQPTDWNLLTFPNNEHFRKPTGTKTATELVLEIAEKGGLDNVKVANPDEERIETSMKVPAV